MNRSSLRVQFWLGAGAGLALVTLALLVLTIGQMGGYLIYVTLSYAALTDSPWLLCIGVPAVFVMGVIAFAWLMDSADPCKRGLGIALTTGWTTGWVIVVPAYLVLSAN
ncbi:hypothetical protein AB0G05_14820 [Nonomuraea wenchangensis]